ncbi:MAG: hypothetical protein Q8P15_02890 [Nanoarchaeota archaeon]|nr:hypothetical protein [Nanoarchaeota archaeon]
MVGQDFIRENPDYKGMLSEADANRILSEHPTLFLPLQRVYDAFNSQQVNLHVAESARRYDESAPEISKLLHKIQSDLEK